MARRRKREHAAGIGGFVAVMPSVLRVCSAQLLLSMPMLMSMSLLELLFIGGMLTVLVVLSRKVVSSPNLTTLPLPFHSLPPPPPALFPRDPRAPRFEFCLRPPVAHPLLIQIAIRYNTPNERLVRKVSGRPRAIRTGSFPGAG